jgi:hypothetical protein
VVTCPETGHPAAVTLDLGHAAATAVWERAELRVENCSRWPGRQGCNQVCVAQIAASPADSRTRTMAERHFQGKRCAICRCLIEPLHATALQPGLMDPGSHEVVAWDDVPPQDLPDAFKARRPICADCTQAERVGAGGSKNASRPAEWRR